MSKDNDDFNNTSTKNSIKHEPNTTNDGNNELENNTPS